MKRDTILIFGAGFSGRHFAQEAIEAGATVYGTTRSKEKAQELQALGIRPVIFDGSTDGDQAQKLKQVLEDVTVLVASAAPDDSGDPVLNTVGAAIAAAPKLEWMAYLSTVGVYGDHGGQWVDETATLNPVSKRSVWRVAAEQQWMDFADACGKGLAILRLSGIYGAGRNAFCNLEKGTARRLVKPGQVFNRIHVADISGALMLLGEKRLTGIFNVTDNEPAPPQDVVEYAASVMKIDPPDEIDFETATLSPMARSFYGENKRVSNAKLKEAGYAFRHPDYRAAFTAMWESDSWK